MFYLCAEFYRGSGRASRSWIKEMDERPDTRDENGDIAYPFNGMGGQVISEHKTLAEAKKAEDVFWDKEQPQRKLASW